jgi:hypothetical protein
MSATKNINAEKIQGVLSITSVSATTYYNLPSTGGSFTGGTVAGATNFTNGLTATTVSATTYYNLPTDVRVTGATYSNNTFNFTNNTGGTFSTLFNTMTGVTINGDVLISGSSLPNGFALSVTGDTNFTGDVYVTGDLTYNGNLLVTGGTVIQSGLTASTIYTDYIDFNTNYTPTQQVGRIHWDVDYGTLDVDLEGNNINLKIGLDNLYYIKNQSGSTINKGRVVRAASTLGTSGRILGEYMIADGSIPYYYTLGIAGENILDGEDGYVYEFGLIKGIDTTGSLYGETWSDGIILYVHPTIAGGLTSIEPTEPNLKIQICIVIKSDSNGSIFVRPSLGYNLGDLHDLQTSGQTNGDLISYDSSNGYWGYSKTLNGSYTITGDTTVGGQMKATTVSATTYFNLPTDVSVTGVTYSSNTFNFTNNTGGTFNVLFNTVTGLTSSGTISTSVLSATTYQNLPNSGVAVVPIATSSVAIGTGSNDYYLNFKIPYDLTISKVDFSVSTAGSDSVRIGIFRGQDLTAVLVGQSASSTVSTLNSFSIVAESGQNLTFSGGSWIVIGVAVGGTTTNLFGSACPVNNLIAWSNTTDSEGGFPTNPRIKGGTRTSFPSIELHIV